VTATTASLPASRLPHRAPASAGATFHLPPSTFHLPFDYQLAFRTPGISPCNAISRNAMRLSPNVRT
jgi:hypothetical protein